MRQRTGVIHHLPQSPKVFPHLPTYSPGCYTPVCCYTLIKARPTCKLEGLGLTRYPPALGTEDAESEGRTTAGNRDSGEGWGSDLEKWGMGASELSFREGSQTGIRDQTRTWEGE